MCEWNLFWPSSPPSMYNKILLIYILRSSIPQLIYWTMSEGELNALTFMSIVVVGGPISLQTLYYKKKKSNRTRCCQSYNGTRINEAKEWKISSCLWGFVHHDCKFVIYFIFLQFAKDRRLFFLRLKEA